MLLPNEYIVSLVTLNQGAAVELFDAEMKRVLDNIADQLQSEKLLELLAAAPIAVDLVEV